MEVSSYRHFNQSNVIFHPVISAPFVGFCSEKHPLHGLKPCKIRAETVHLLSDKQNHPIPYRLDGIGLSGRIPALYPNKQKIQKPHVLSMRGFCIKKVGVIWFLQWFSSLRHLILVGLHILFYLIQGGHGIGATMAGNGD